jgi:hypothetical protein
LKAGLIELVYKNIIEMFPGSYSFNPGVGKSIFNVVLDPITMTPMISGSSFTVNPLGVAGKR